MNQTALALEATQPADHSTEADRVGFDIGWDHAHHGLVPPAELLLEGTPLGQGWRASRAVSGRRTLATQRATRQWLALRTLAWRRGISYERSSWARTTWRRSTPTAAPCCAPCWAAPKASPTRRFSKG